MMVEQATPTDRTQGDSEKEEESEEKKFADKSQDGGQYVRRQRQEGSPSCLKGGERI